jgi:hypothetical protein
MPDGCKRQADLLADYLERPWCRVGCNAAISQGHAGFRESSTPSGWQTALEMPQQSMLFADEAVLLLAVRSVL